VQKNIYTRYGCEHPDGYLPAHVHLSHQADYSGDLAKVSVLAQNTAQSA
jgi:hypothetical protein